MHRTCRSRVSRVTAVLLGLLAAAACLGPSLKYEEQRLRNKCGLTGRDAVTLEQARCIAKAAGLKEGRKCPFELNETVREDERRVIEIRETCSALGLDIDKATGRIVAVEVGDAAAP